MAKHTRHKPLIIVTPHDLGPPIYYSPQEDAVLLFSQILSAILLGVRELDEEQISVGLESLKMFFNEYQDRHMLYYGGGALLVIPNAYRDKEKLLQKLRDIFNQLKVPLKIKYWDDLDMKSSITLFAMDLRLRTTSGISSFITNIDKDIKEWERIAQEYRQTGVVFLGQTRKDQNILQPNHEHYSDLHLW